MLAEFYGFQSKEVIAPPNSYCCGSSDIGLTRSTVCEIWMPCSVCWILYRVRMSEEVANKSLSLAMPAGTHIIFVMG